MILVPPRCWEESPDLILEDVYTLLSFPDRHSCSQVCWAWYDAFYFPRIWRHIVVTPRSFTYRRFNWFLGYQRDINKHRVQMWLSRVGRHVRTITVLPNPCLHNIYGFLEVLTKFLEYFDEYPMPRLDSFSYSFCCETRGLWTDEMVLIGTGGPFLELLKELLASFRGLKRLVLNNLLLQSHETETLLDDFTKYNGGSLEYLELLNSSKTPYPLYPLARLSSLVTLVISPSHVSDDMLLVVLQETRLKQLILVQDRYSLDTPIPIEHRTWWSVKQIAPYLEVALEVRGRTEKEVLIQSEAPVTRIMYKTCTSEVKVEQVMRIIDEYRTSLRVYGHTMIHRKHRCASFAKRADRLLVMMAKDCKKLQCLAITERVSTATLLLIATEAKNLKKLYVRRNAVIVRFDWVDSGWTDKFRVWLKDTSLSYETTEKEIGRILGSKWHMLSDKDFKHLNI